MERNKTPESIAFEGINRAGKGTQIQLLQQAFVEFGIEGVALRGDGTREGSGEHRGDPYSPEWRRKVDELRAAGTDQEWHYAAYQLANEFAAWKKELAGVQNALILLDRSLISRGSFVLKRSGPYAGLLEINDLYPVQPGKILTLEDVLPDVIFELLIPKELALARLDPKDPKSGFRKKIIEESYEIFYRTKDKLPKVVQDRIVTIDSSQPIDKVFDDVVFTLNDRFNLFHK